MIELPIQGLGFDPEAALGIYVHVPFCARRCPYCDFAIAVRDEVPHQRYLDALLRELDARAASSCRQLETLYFGGGTPSMWSHQALQSLLNEIRRQLGSAREVTLEANPEDLSFENLEAWQRAGVNRLSLGVQSLNDTVLHTLGRGHNRAMALDAIRRAQALGFEQLNVDLIFGNHGQALNEIDATIELLSETGVNHFSLYSLTIEARTVFGRRTARGERYAVDDEAMADRLEHIWAMARRLGLRHYEISNFGRDGALGRHNLLYWHGGEYLGLGMGAHSLQVFDDGRARRRSHGAHLFKYMSDPLGHWAEDEDLAAPVHLAERLLLGLRTDFGVDLKALAKRFGNESLGCFEPALRQLESRGWLRREGEILQVSEQGLLFHDSLSALLIEAV